MSAVFAIGKLDMCLKEGIDDLVRAHWREVALDQDAVPLSVNWAQYEEMEQRGILFAVTMHVDGKLVGYNIFFVMPHIHYSTTLHALNDIVYVRPEHRGIDGVRLILEAERQLKARGAVKVLYHSKSDLLLAAETRGEGKADSLDRLDQLLDLETEFDVQLPDSVANGEDMTLGAVLQHLGYKEIESVYAKLLR